MSSKAGTVARILAKNVEALSPVCYALAWHASPDVVAMGFEGRHWPLLQKKFPTKTARQ